VPTFSCFPSGAANSSVQKFPSAAVTPIGTVFSSERLTKASAGGERRHACSAHGCSFVLDVLPFRAYEKSCK
jgi:hypothetical protein